MASDISSVDSYIASQPEAVRAVLEKVRAAIRRAIPRAEEVISYSIPAYKVDGRVVIYFGAWKHHFALYPVTEALRAKFGDDLASYEGGKGTIRFPFSEPAPLRLIGRIARFRMNETAARVKATAAARKKR